MGCDKHDWSYSDPCPYCKIAELEDKWNQYVVLLHEWLEIPIKSTVTGDAEITPDLVGRTRKALEGK